MKLSEKERKLKIAYLIILCDIELLRKDKDSHPLAFIVHLNDIAFWTNQMRILAQTKTEL